MNATEIIAGVEAACAIALAGIERPLTEAERAAFQLGFIAGTDHGIALTQREYAEVIPPAPKQ